MFYTIYKITNKVNNKYYIGKHQTKNLNDNYFGSGKLLKRAIEKHGKENFVKEILHVFDNEVEMNAKEKELVVLGESSYNICPGGQGGFGYINSIISKDEKRQRSINGGLKPWTEERKQKHSSLLSTLRKQGRFTYIIKPEHRNMKGCPNTCWINNGVIDCKIKKIELTDWLNKGFVRGRCKIPWNRGIPRTEEDKRKIKNGMLKQRRKKLLASKA